MLGRGVNSKVTEYERNTFVKELTENGLRRLKGSAGIGRAGEVSAAATPLEGVPMRGQGVEGFIDRQADICEPLQYENI